MGPLGALVTIREVSGPLLITRYNMYPTAFINGSAAFGVSSGEAIEKMEEITAKRLPVSMAYEWTEMAFLEQKAGSTAMLMFLMSVVFVFLVLAALYESWSLPLTIILVVPMCMFSAIVGVIIARMDINIFTQVGFVVLVGLASKNAILIVEYAKVQRATTVRMPLHGGHAHLVPIAAAAHHHDVVRVHSRRGAALARGRRRRRNASYSGHRCLQRHAGRHAIWHLSDPCVLLRYRRHWRRRPVCLAPDQDRPACRPVRNCSWSWHLPGHLFQPSRSAKRSRFLFFTIVAPWLVMGLGQLLRKARRRRTW